MSKLYNAQTGEEESLPLDQIPAAIQAGTHAYKKGTVLDVVDKDGKAYTVDAAELPQVFNEGFSLESPDQAAIREYVKENKGIGGALKVAGTQFVDEAAMGLPELIADKTQDPLEVAKREALKKEHSLANTVGGLAGFGASLFTGAPIAKLGEAAGKAITAKIAALTGKEVGEQGAKTILGKAAEKATEMGVEGTVLAAPTAITEAALGDPSAAAESLMIGGILGGALGGTTGLVKPLAKLGKDKLDYVTNKKNVETDAAFNILGATPAARAKVAPDVEERLPQFLRDIAKDDKSVLLSSDKLSKKIAEVEEVAGKKIGEVVKTLDDRLKQTVNEVDDVALAEIKDSMYNYDNLIAKLDDKFIKPYKDDIRYNAQIQQVENEIANIRNIVSREFAGNPQPINLGRLREFQKSTKDLVNYDTKNKMSSLGVDARKEIVSDIQNYFKNDLAPKIPEAYPDLKAVASQFKEANDVYRVATTVSPIIEKAVNKEAAKQLFSFGDVLVGAAGYGLGDIEGAATAIAARKGANFLNRAFDVGGLLLAEKSMKNTAKSLDLITKKLQSLDKPIRMRASTAISDLTGNKEDDDFNRLSNKITEAAANPQKLEGYFSSTLDVMSDQGAPQIAEAAKVKTMETMQYLNSIIPKPLTPNNPLVKSKGYKPSDMELNRFKRQVRTALDPMSVVDDLNEGSLTVDQVQVLSDLYPDLLNRIKEKVTDAVTENPTEIPYNKRIKLSVLLGLDLDPSISQPTLGILVNAKSDNPNLQAPAPSNNVKFTSYPTETQRIMNKA